MTRKKKPVVNVSDGASRVYYDECLEPIVEEATRRICVILKKEPSENRLKYFSEEMSKLYAGFFYNCCLQHQCLMCCAMAWTEATHRALAIDDGEHGPHSEAIH